ncbi:MAG: ABC transporter ATP-binding protein/permease [Oscillospiraceae bacterium]|nr:ABC transporter ATP-binding protein/permease [Oscillospiraceae bacterium]
MMINKRLIGTVSESKKYIAGNVAAQWCGMVSNACLIFSVGAMLERLSDRNSDGTVNVAAFAAAALIIRMVCSVLQARFSYLSSKTVKKTLRGMIFNKLLRLGSSYREQAASSEIVQVSVEGVEQLETYFGAYLPQFFYAMLAPLTLFAALCFVSVKAAAVLLVCVPLIPVSIICVQKIAKKLLSKYWGQYTALGDTFLENLQGLTTLKIYKSDEYKNDQMNEESEKFRRITMKVLTMQLNSITIMDFVAFGGAAVGIIIAASEFTKGNIGFSGCFSIIMLSAEFCIPMRRLGSFFHVAMNGMAASDKIFRLLDLPEPEIKSGEIIPDNCGISVGGLSYSYEAEREVLHKVDLKIPMNVLTAVVGESGCGKSTIAAVLTGRNKNYSGSVKIGGTELSEISEKSISRSVTYIGHNSYIFKGTVRENLLMGNSSADDKMLWAALEKARLADFMRSEKGLDTELTENAGNLSGGQRQRLALARALLHDTPIYIFDEATSNIDSESENFIMEEIYRLSEHKTVILISHRLANSAEADMLYVLESGNVTEQGTHNELLGKKGVYCKLWETQKQLESIGRCSQ